MLSRNMRHGHICLDLGKGPVAFEDALLAFTWPELKTWQKDFAKNRTVGRPDEGRPLVLDDTGRLIRRYWEYEKTLAQGILMRCDGQTPTNPRTGDLQGLAIETALARRFVVISGGPGTGKTTTVLKILERMVSAQAEIDFLGWEWCFNIH
jgi:exodeoxyribonuclease V alpha subunit